MKVAGSLVFIPRGRGHLWRIAEVAHNGDCLCESSHGWAYWFCADPLVEAFGPFQEFNPDGISLAAARGGQ